MPELQQAAEGALRALQEVLSPWGAGPMPPTGLSAWNTLQDCYGEPELTRLREIKRRVDPHGTLVGNFPIP